MKIVIVYLGNSLPLYVLDNLRYIKDVVPSGSLVFISEDDKILAKVSKIGVDTWKCTDPNISWNEVRSKLSHPENFRNGFWFKTIARFFAISQYMRLTGESVLQIEADVWLAKNFPFVKFEEICDKIAFPLESKATGAASILWIPKLELLDTLLELVENELILNGHATDMTILGKFSMQYPKLTFILPSIVPQLEDYENKVLITMDSKQQVPVEFGGLFDPLTYGLFLLGADARNSRGFKILFSRPTAHSALAETYKYFFETDLLYVQSENSSKIPLYCLHVHSKDRSIFNNKRRARTLELRIAQSEQGVRKEFEIVVYLNQSIKYFRKKMNV